MPLKYTLAVSTAGALFSHPSSANGTKSGQALDCILSFLLEFCMLEEKWDCPKLAFRRVDCPDFSYLQNSSYLN